MHNLSIEINKVMARPERAGVQGDCGPKLNDEQDASVWLDQEGSPKAKLDNDELFESWEG